MRLGCAAVAVARVPTVDTIQRRRGHWRMTKEQATVTATATVRAMRINGAMTRASGSKGTTAAPCRSRCERGGGGALNKRDVRSQRRAARRRQLRDRARSTCEDANDASEDRGAAAIDDADEDVEKSYDFRPPVPPARACAHVLGQLADVGVGVVAVVGVVVWFEISARASVARVV